MPTTVQAFISVTEDDRPLLVRPRASLAERPSAAVLIAEAPDGLPLVLDVERRASVAEPVTYELGLDECSLPAEIAEALASLERSVQRYALANGRITCDGRTLYVTAASPGLLLGDTLLVRALGVRGPLDLEADERPEEPGRRANTAVVAMAAEPGVTLTRLGARLRLGVGLDEGPPLVVSDAPDMPARPLAVEDLRRLPSAQAHWRDKDGNHSTAIEDRTTYERAVREATKLAWSVSRHDLGATLVELARALAELHRHGIVHADVTPANTLVTAAGVLAHDPLAVPAGEVSVAATPGWAAPEQVLARPVSPATDVHALGLLAARVVDAVIYGEERCFVSPTGGNRRHRLRVLIEPAVFLDPTHLGLDRAARTAWERLLARAVAFDPSARFADGDAFADALAELLELHPIPGRVSLSGGPGKLVRNVELLGRVQPAWVLYGRR